MGLSESVKTLICKDLSKLFNKGVKKFKGFRVGVFLCIGVACLVVKENYPFSNFPMYSNFGKSTTMLYVTDEQDRPLPLMDNYGMRTSILKKVYQSEIKRLAKEAGVDRKKLSDELKAEAADITLERVLGYRTDMQYVQRPWPELRLYEVTIRIKDDKLTRETEFLGRKEIQSSE